MKNNWNSDLVPGVTDAAVVAAAMPGPVLVVDDEASAQARLRSALKSLGYADGVLNFASSIAEAQLRINEQSFALAFVDVGLPDGSGIDLIRALHERNPDTIILVVTGWNTEKVILACLQAGASGYLLKEHDEMETMLSIRSALRGGAPIDPFVARHILDFISNDRKPAPEPARTSFEESKPSLLTPREMETLSLVSKGLTNNEIAQVLTLSKLTVGCHIRNIYKKLAVNSRTEAVFEARSHGLLF